MCWSGAGGGGARRNRTADLLNAIQALYQLSYGPPGVPSGVRPYNHPARGPQPTPRSFSHGTLRSHPQGAPLTSRRAPLHFPQGAP